MHFFKTLLNYIKNYNKKYKIEGIEGFAKGILELYL